MSQPFDFDKVLKSLWSGQVLTGKDGILMPLIKQLTEAAFVADLDSHLVGSLNPTRKMASIKRPLNPQRGVSNGLCRLIVMARSPPS